MLILLWVNYFMDLDNEIVIFLKYLTVVVLVRQFMYLIGNNYNSVAKKVFMKS